MERVGISRPLIIVAVLVILALLVLTVMQWNTYKENSFAVETEEMVLSQAKSRLESLKGLKEREGEFREQLAVLEQMMPAGAGDDQLLIDLQSAADLSALRFASIRFGELAEAEGFTAVPVNLTFEGQYFGIINLLDYIRSYERAVRINELRLTAKGDPPGLNVNINASVFYTGQ